ncbi:MAG: YggT family protein [Chloroflexi bacterium]|jgi:YggT family protein|nr:YggT family protein [Chloroflexota bacterium]MBT3670440.1 YggT family protein [Chloroflexota bacterium]MBT4002690.1 YggT family protein [Chloroflexota bacterium]MBT4304658.1 YggT family protein [Chloroflexota bacterium]MBT4534227.1 YggT family protein [Chloroflexota bacterium]
MTTTLIWLVNTTVSLITFLLFIYVISSYFISPFHPIRQTLEKIIRPLLDPIRRILPSMGGIDLSPLVLWLALRFIGIVLNNIILTL